MGGTRANRKRYSKCVKIKMIDSFSLSSCVDGSGQLDCSISRDIPVLERRCICVPRREAPLLVLGAVLAFPDCEIAMCTEFIDALDKILW